MPPVTPEAQRDTPRLPPPPPPLKRDERRALRHDGMTRAVVCAQYPTSRLLRAQSREDALWYLGVFADGSTARDIFWILDEDQEPAPGGHPCHASPR